MAIYQEKNKAKWTKDGRSWYFRTYYEDIRGIRKQKQSRKYFTKENCIETEKKFIEEMENLKINYGDMTFKDLYRDYYIFQKDKVRESTLNLYAYRLKYLDILEDVKISQFNLESFELWKKNINKKNISTSYKNSILKFLKAMMAYGRKYHNLSFNNVYDKITNFNNPMELPKEMLFFTLEEFKNFIKIENDLRYKTIYETFYYLGLRQGELRGLQWKDIDFKNKFIHLSKQIPSMYSLHNYKITPLKTNKSNRTLPINNIVYDDLIKLYNYNQKKYKGFNPNYFVFGTSKPISKEKIAKRKNYNCKIANVKQIRIHDFRHSCASLLINNGASITLVAKYLGHSKINETLNTYSHLFNNTLIDIVNIIEKL